MSSAARWVIFSYSYPLHGEVLPGADSLNTVTPDKDLNHWFLTVFSSSFRYGFNKNCLYTGDEVGSLQENLIKLFCWFSCLGIFLLTPSNVFSSKVSKGR